jgi:hypothetical protein
LFSFEWPDQLFVRSACSKWRWEPLRSDMLMRFVPHHLYLPMQRCGYSGV